MKKHPSITDVANAAGVSRAAVSRVLNKKPIRISDEKRDAIVEAARTLGYRVHAGARRLALRKLNTIGLLFPHNPSTLSQFYLFELSRQLALTALEAGYDVLVDYFHPKDLASFSPAAGRVDGTILLRDRGHAAEQDLKLEEMLAPLLVIGGGFQPPVPRYCVELDLEQGMLEIGRLLTGLGHRRIAFVSVLPSPGKLAGLNQAAEEAGLPVPQPVILQGEDLSDIAQAVDALFAAPNPPTAIAAGNDAVALRILKILHDRGIRVPDQVSLTGFDDVEPAILASPELTTVHIPMLRLAQLAVPHLLRLIEQGAGDPMHEKVQLEIVVRASTAAPPA